MKNKKKYFLIAPIQFFFLLISLIIGSCCNHAETYMVPEDFKKYFYFPEGSYWVYENQFDKYDTLTVTSVESKIEKEDESCRKTEIITILYQSSQVGSLRILAQTNFLQFNLCEYISFHNYFTELTDFGTYTNGEKKAQSCSSEIEWWIEDTVVINDKNYYDVVVNKTTSFIPPSIADFPLKGYFKENIGLIKRELQNGEIWELVDYKINK